MCNIENRAGNVLDLVFTNNFFELSINESTKPLIKSDIWHKAIEVEFVVNESEHESNSVTELYKYEAADYGAMNEFFVERDISSEIVQLSDIGMTFQMFGNIVHEAMEKFVPKVAVEKGTAPIWYTKQLKHMNDLRRKAFKRAKATMYYEEYNNITNSFMQLQGEESKRYIDRIQSQIGTDPKYFWRFVND